jgi:hypothetical protein
MQVPLGAQCVNAAGGGVDGRRAARAGGIRHRVVGVVLDIPEGLAGGGVEAVHAFGAGEGGAGEGVGGAGAALLDDEVGEDDFARGDGGRGVPAGDGHAPGHLRAAGRERIDDSLLAPDAVAMGAHPLRVIIRAGDRAEDR